MDINIELTLYKAFLFSERPNSRNILNNYYKNVSFILLIRWNVTKTSFVLEFLNNQWGLGTEQK
jgi:hypothetical protein